MLKLGIAVIGVRDLDRATAFWTAALDLVDDEQLHTEQWRTLRHADSLERALALQRSESPVESHPRVHLDLYTADRAEQHAEVERLVGLGASRLDWDSYPENADFVVLADPDDNPFCIIDLGFSASQG